VLSRLLDYLFAALFGTFQRMIFWELARVFLLCLCALAGVFTLLAILQQIQFGVSLGQALRMLPLLVPTSVPWITPPACLFASCVVYGRLANDNEAVALKAAGVDLLSVLRPALVLGACAAAFTAYLQFDVTPQAWRGSREVLIDDPEEAISLVLKRKQTLEFLSGDEWTKLSVRAVQDQRLEDVVVKQRKRESKGWEEFDRVGRTHAATLWVGRAADGKPKVSLNASEWKGLKRGANGQSIHSVDNTWDFDLPADFDLNALKEKNANNPAMVDWMHLPGRAAYGEAEAATHRQYAGKLSALPDRPLSADEVADFHAEVGIPPAPDPALRLEQIQNEQNTVNQYARLDRVMRYEYHLRPAIAFGCLLFAAVGCPVGLWANRADYLSIFVICFLPALVVYYPVLFMVGGYAREGKIPMAAGVWTANGVLALAAAVLSWRLIRR
jgi:lipopolysaccharide export system permease protein